MCTINTLKTKKQCINIVSCHIDAISNRKFCTFLIIVKIKIIKAQQSCHI